MKAGYICAIVAFAVAVCAIAFLSEPDETTRVALYLDNHQLKHAEELLRRQYQRDPDNLDAAAKLVETLRALKEFSAAREISLAVLKRHPDSIKMKRELAYIFLDEKDPDSAASLLAPNERDSDFWEHLAQAWHDHFQEELAEKALFAAHANDRDKAGVWSLLAKWRAERNNIAGEKEALEEALNIEPADMDLITRYFRNRAKAGDLKAALEASGKLPRPLNREILEDLFRLYIANKDYAGAQSLAEELVARKDTIPADTLALASSLYLQNKFSAARELLANLAAQSGNLPKAIKDAIASQTKATLIAMLLESAETGDERPLINEIENLENGKTRPDPEILRQLLYACLQLSDFHKGLANNADTGGKGKSRVQFWLDEAQSIFRRYGDSMPLSESANARVAADIAERRGDWAAMLNAWKMVAAHDKPDLGAHLGIARAYEHLHDYEASWQSLARAEALVRNDAEMLEVALQAQNISGSLPENDPDRQEKLRHADDLARKCLAKNWNADLALNLFYRMLRTDRLAEADELLGALARRGLATPGEYLGLAEAQVADLRKRGAKGKAARERALRNAKEAYENAIPEMLPRLLYIFTRLNERPQVADIIKRIEREKISLSPDLLRQMADAYGSLGNQKRQFALMEQRARMSGQLADWEEAIDQRYWQGDHQGALELLNQAENHFPANGALMSRHLLALADLGDFRGAIKYFQSIKRQNFAVDNKLSAESLAALAQAYDKTSFPDRARHFYNLALTKEPANNRATYGLADLLRRGGNEDKASHLLREFIARNPANPWARAQLAELRPEREKAQYENIISGKQKGGAPEKALKAFALYRTGRTREALHIYAELMKDPGRTDRMMCEYSRILMDLDEFEKAKRVLLAAISEFPGELQPRRLLANVYIREKKYAAAESCLRDALKISPSNPEILGELAYVLQAQKKFWSAQKTFRAGGKR